MNQSTNSPQSNCDSIAGQILPIVDPARCECKGSCVSVCPYNVFEIRPLSAQQKNQLTWFTRLRVWIHGGAQAFVATAEACHACGLCAEACPESAISFKILPKQGGQRDRAGNE